MEKQVVKALALKIQWEGTGWIHLAPNGDKWQAFMYSVMDVRVP
jgi:hypothetical protein